MSRLSLLGSEHELLNVLSPKAEMEPEKGPAKTTVLASTKSLWGSILVWGGLGHVPGEGSNSMVSCVKCANSESSPYVTCPLYASTWRL